MNAHSMNFDGALIARGFWLYVWEIADGSRTVLYVGRTGDTSLPNASSPFRRISQHLDSKANAKGNALLKQLTRAKLVPERCHFEMVAIGPLFPEQRDPAQHRLFRDKTAALERMLADHLRKRGYDVLGAHPGIGAVDTEVFTQIRQIVDDRWPGTV